MKDGSISVYNEGVTWLVGLSAAAVGGAFLHYDALSGAPWYARALFVAASLLFLATVYFGVHYAFWLYSMSNQRERRQGLKDELLAGTIDKEEYSRELADIDTKIADATQQIAKHHRHLFRFFGLGVIFAAVLLLVLAVCGASGQTANGGGPGSKPPKPESSQVTVRFGDPIEKAIVDRLRNSGTSPVPGTTAPPNSRTPWIILLIIGVLAAAALIWRVAEHAPEATPLTVALTVFGGATGLLAKLAAEKPLLPLHLRWWLCIAFAVFLVAGLFLLWLALQRLTDSQRGLFGSALLVFGFSAILLALVPPMLFHAEATAQDKHPHPQWPPPAVPSPEIEVLPLTSVNNLGDRESHKNIAPQQIQMVIADAIKNEARKGDILLLLGSADCIPTRPKSAGGLWKDNEELAGARADWVKSDLQGDSALSGISIESRPLPQHLRCGKTSDVRAVYPFLIHAKENQAANTPSTNPGR